MAGFLKNSLLVVVSLLIFAAIAEVGLRIAGVSYPVLHRLEAQRGWGPWPGIEGVYRRTGNAVIRFNDAGFRGPDVPVDPPDGTFRIAVLGDSMTEAREVNEDQTFVGRLPAALAQCAGVAGRKVEALNFGVSGYGGAQQLLTLETRALAFKPDIVLLAFFAGNDVSNNARALDGHPDRPYFLIDGTGENGGLRLDRSTLDSDRFRSKMRWRNLTNRIVNASVLVQFIRDAIYKLRKGGRQAGIRFVQPGLEDTVMKPPTTPEWKTAWRVTEKLLLRMKDVTKASGARFAMTTLSIPVQVYPDPAKRQTFMESQKIVDLFYPDRRLAAFGARESIPAFTLAAAMQEAADRDKIYFHGFENRVMGDGHYNPAGHAKAAELIAAGLCETLLSPK